MGNGESGIGRARRTRVSRTAAYPSRGRMAKTSRRTKRPEVFHHSRFPIPDSRNRRATEDRRDSAHRASRIHRYAVGTIYVTRISPPAPRVHRPSSGKGILRRRRVLVELRSPDDTRQKPIRVGSPPITRRLARATPTVQLTSVIKAITVPQAFDMLKYQCGPDSSLSNARLLLTRTTVVSVAEERHYCCVLQRRPRFA